MTDTKFVSIINQTARPQYFNLAPISQDSISLPPRGRVTILEEELKAHEISGALKSSPPRIAVQVTKPKSESKTTQVAAKPAAPKISPKPSYVPAPEPAPVPKEVKEEPVVEAEDKKKASKK